MTATLERNDALSSTLSRAAEASTTPTTAEQATDEMNPTSKRPFLLRFRSSTGFIALCVGFGVLVDLSSYSIVVPVIPFRLAAIGYPEERIGSLTGWLVAAYAGGLIVSSPPAAWIGSRFKNRQIPLSLSLLFMAGAIILFMLTDSYAAMVVARILQGFSGTCLWTIGLALVTDSVPEQRAGVVLGQVMLGFSVGQSIGPPVGGTIYDRHGYRAPFYFSLALVGFDMLLRLCIIEKHTALRYIAEGHGIKGFEAPGYTEAVKEVKGESEGEREREKEVEVPLSGRTEGDEKARRGEKDVEKNVAASGEGGWMSKIPEEFLGFWVLCRSPRAMTDVYLSFMNGFVVGSLLDTAMTIYLEEEYGLSSLGAGLVFLGVVVPTFFASPLAGWITDKYGTKYIMFFGILLSIPVFPLLIIRGPLALFVFFLVIEGISVSCFITPVTVDLSICAAEAKGMQTAHVFGMFNMAFSLGSFIGPIVAGQILAAVQIRSGWLILAILSSVLSALSLPAVLWWVGGPLKRRKKEDAGGEGAEEKAVGA